MRLIEGQRQMIEQTISTRLFGGVKGFRCVDMILTDIPYLISQETNFKTIKDFTKKQGETEYNCMDFGEWDKELKHT